MLAGAALASSGFVYESVQARRQKARQSLRTSILSALDEAMDAGWRRPHAKWRRPLLHRRQRGEGYGRSAEQDPAQETYDFSTEGQGPGATTLSADVIRAVMRHHDVRLGRCLLRHGAKSVDVHFEVGSDGRMKAVRLDLSGAAEQCLRTVLDAVRFPSRSGGPVKGSYQLRMQ